MVPKPDFRSVQARAARGGDFGGEVGAANAIAMTAGDTGVMPVYADEVVVLRAAPLGEADRIITLFGRERGMVRAVARGVRRTSSKFGARLEPFNVVDVQLYTRNFRNRSGLETVTQAVTVHPLAAKIVADYEAYTAAAVVVESAMQLLTETPAPNQWVLLVGALRDLAAQDHPAQLVMVGYLLRSLALAGWQPSFNECARCGAPGPHARISYSAGGAVCDACAIAVGATVAADIDVMRHLWALLAGNRHVQLSADTAVRERAGDIAIAYAEHHLEHSLRATRIADAARRHGAN